MTRMLIKNRKDHRRLRGLIDGNTKTLTMTPATGALTGGTNGTPYTTTIAVTNGIGASRFSISTGTLPTGLTLNPASGVISGTPTQAVAARAFTVSAVDAFGNVGSTAYTLTIT